MAATTTTIELSPLTKDAQPVSVLSAGGAGGAGTSSPAEEEVDEDGGQYSKGRAAAIIITVAGVNLLNTLSSGILTVALPQIAKDLQLSRELLLWPASIYALTCGCSLLLAGSMADIVGRRKVFLLGCALCSGFTLGCGLAKTGPTLIVFRALLGVSISLCLTTAVGIITTSFPPSTRRNIAFACTGAASPVGYTLGLVMGGVFVESIGWRWAFYLATIVNSILVGSAIWGLPPDEPPSDIWKKLVHDIDWIGALIATVAISLLSYVMAVITGSSSNIREPANIALLSTGIILFPAFAFWMSRQERLGRPAIIPNSIWKNRAFTWSCVAVFLTWGAFNPFGYFSTLFFQEVQTLSALQTSLRFLPTVVCGILTNIATGFLVKNTKASYLVAGSTIFSAVACLLMAIVNPAWKYWICAFPAMFLSPMSSDVLYTISNLVIADAFPGSKQSLAGGVFNTLSQIGNSVGLTVGAVIASTVTGVSHDKLEDINTDSLMRGFKATFWACFTSMATVVFVSLLGLKKAGKVGLKKE